MIKDNVSHTAMSERARTAGEKMKTDSTMMEALPYRWVVLALMASCFLFTFIVRFTWPPLIPVVVPVLNMKMSQAGAFMSAFYLGYIITQIPAGLLADKFGVRLLLTFSLLIEGAATFGMAYITTFEQGFFLRIVSGLGAGAVYSACTRALMEWFPPKERGTAFGLLLAAVSGGIVLSGRLVPPLNAAFGWTGAFQTIGAVTILVGILIFFLVKSSSTVLGGSMLEGFKIVFGNKDLILTSLSGFCLLWVELGTATWTVAHIKNLGFGLKEAGMVLMWYGVGGMLAPTITGWLSDKFGHRKLLYIAGLIVICPLTVYFGSLESLSMLSAVGFLFGFISYGANPHLTVMISEFAGRAWSATANGASNCFFQFASMISPLVIGLSIDWTGSHDWVWWIMAAGPLMGVFFMLPVNPENKAE